VLGYKNSDVEVEFIDFGYVEYVNTDEIVQLVNNVYKIRKIARKCTLLPPVEVQQWSKAGTKKFKSMAMDGDTIFTINLVEPKVKNVVELTYGFTQSVREELVKHQLLADKEAYIIDEHIEQILLIMKSAHLTRAKGINC
jgi:hypothetical protein